MRIESRNPATSEVVATFEAFDQRAIAERLERATAAFRSWRRTPFEARARLLTSIAHLLERDADRQVVRTDAVLDIGDLAEEVTVEIGATVLATDRATISETIDTQQVTELPSEGRNVWTLAETAPSVLRGYGLRGGTSWTGAG